MTILQYTYATLAAAMQDWPEDDDPDYVAAIPQLIAHGELKLARDLDLEIFETDLTASIASASPYITKPASILVGRTLGYTQDSVYTELEQRTVDYVRQYGRSSVAGRPLYYAELSETQWLVAPTPNFSLSNGMEIRAIARNAGLDQTTPSSTSWFSTRMPDLLLWSCLISGGIYLKDDAKYVKMMQDYAIRVPVAAAEVAPLRRKYAVSRQTLEGITRANAPPSGDEE